MEQKTFRIKTTGQQKYIHDFYLVYQNSEYNYVYSYI